MHNDPLQPINYVPNAPPKSASYVPGPSNVNLGQPEASSSRKT